MAGFAVLYSQPFVFSLNKKFGVGNIAALNLLTKKTIFKLDEDGKTEFGAFYSECLIIYVNVLAIQ